MRRQRQAAFSVAYTALLAALSLVILYGSCLAPTGRAGVVGLAGLLPAAAVISGGPSSGVLCYAGTGILAFLLLPDKGNALLYLLFFGLYPLVKYSIERIRRLPLELVLKLAFFNGMLSVFWFVLRTIFLSAIPLSTQSLPLLYLGGSAVFLMYDFGFSKLISFYIARVDKPLRNGRSAN